jgi:hypothetical protein
MSLSISHYFGLKLWLSGCFYTQYGARGLVWLGAYGYNPEALPSKTLVVLPDKDRTQQLIPNRLRKL